VSSDVGTVSAGVRSSAAGDPGICVHHGGRSFVVTREHAGVFLRRVQAIADQGGSELVPLLHSTGLELLYIASNVPLQVHDVRDLSLHRG
jgi:hypothetical protein